MVITISVAVFIGIAASILFGIATLFFWSPSILVMSGLKLAARMGNGFEGRASISKYLAQGAGFKGLFLVLIAPVFFMVENKTAWKLTEIIPSRSWLYWIPALWVAEPVLFLFAKEIIGRTILGMCQFVFVWIISSLIFTGSQQ
jgi:hypothetical protein